VDLWRVRRGFVALGFALFGLEGPGGVCFGRRLMCVKVRRGIQEVRMGQEIVILDDFVRGKGRCEFMVPMYVPHYP
jgi:hypothetical protein